MNNKDDHYLNLTRRQFLAGSATGTAAAMLPLSLYAKQGDKEVKLKDYQPQFFNATEWAFILAATDRLIPQEGEGPGAHEANVPVYIDIQLTTKYGEGKDWYMQGPHDASVDPARGYQTPYTPAELYQKSIKAINQWCQDHEGKDFAELDGDKQDDILSQLEKRDLGLNDDLGIFFDQLLQNTKEGYLADPMYGGNKDMQAWVYIGFPGARASYKEWAEQRNVTYPLGPVSISGKRA